MKQPLARWSGIAGCIFLSQMWPALASPPEEVLATAHVAEFLYGEIGGSIETRLASSGLDPTEVQAIALKAVQGYAVCTVESLVKDDDPRSRMIVTLFARGLFRDELNAEMSRLFPGDSAATLKEALALRLKTCGQTVEQELGLPPTQ